MQLFENTEIAFRHRGDNELKKAALLFRLMGNPHLVNLLGKIALAGMKMNIPLRWFVKPTIFNHFCGGENLRETKRIVDSLAKFNVGSVPDYAAESQNYVHEKGSVINEIINTMDFALKHSSVSFSVFKPSALAPADVLAKADPFNNLPEDEIKGIEKFRNNIRKICQAAGERGVPVMIDAEEFHYQHIVDRVAEEMMELYNKEKAIVFTTLQMYRHDRLDYLNKLLDDARQKKYFPGLKIVRGAYLELERSRALKMGYHSPVYQDKKGTDNAFNSAISVCLKNIDITNLFAGTHNEESLLFLVKKMKEYKLKRDDPRIFVSQLYGMSDHISFNMASQSYNVAKYLPYGPIKILVPYLIRRAEENKAVTGQAGRELALIKKEIKRRKSTKPEKQ